MSITGVSTKNDINIGIKHVYTAIFELRQGHIIDAFERLNVAIEWLGKVAEKTKNYGGLSRV